MTQQRATRQLAAVYNALAGQKELFVRKTGRSLRDETAA